MKSTNMQQAEDTMELTVNGEIFDGEVTTLAELIRELGYGDQRVATAVNGSFVAGNERKTYELRDGDEIEVVAPRQGG
ncbi:MAG: sulfur carrier protein ThiS [Hyphomicrobiaceae bacterium]